MQTTSKLRLRILQDADLIDEADFNYNAQRLEDYVTSLTQACSATSPAALSLTTALKTVSFGAKVQTGYAFGLSGGGVKVLEPGFVKAHVHVYAQGLAPGDQIGVDVAKNGATYWQYSAEGVVGDSAHVDLTSRLTPVAKNDIITLKIRNVNRNGGAIVPVHTYMTVDLYKDLNF